MASTTATAAAATSAAATTATASLATTIQRAIRNVVQLLLQDRNLTRRVCPKPLRPDS